MLRLACAVFAAVSIVPVVHAQSTPAAKIQSGTYDLEITFGGGVLEGTLEVTTAGDSLAVALQVGGHASPVRLSERKENQLVLESTNPGIEVRYELEFRGETVTGTFIYEGQSGTLTGRRRQA
jgi:hypothetical protein